MSQWLPLLSETAEFAAQGFAAAMRAMEAEPEEKASKSFRQWLTEVPCDPLPFPELDQAVARHTGGEIYITDYRWGKAYVMWDPTIRGEFNQAKHATSAACLPGRIVVHLLCSQQAILRTALSDFGYHLQAVQAMSGFANDILSQDLEAEDLLTVSGAGKGEGWKGCASWTAWQNVLVHRPAMEAYANRMLTERIPWPPQPGNMHLVAFEPPLRYQQRSLIHPRWRLCAPLKARECFPAYAELDCYSCCDIRLGPRGKESCWEGPYTFEACCQRDYRDEEKRMRCVTTGAC